MKFQIRALSLMLILALLPVLALPVSAEEQGTEMTLHALRLGEESDDAEEGFSSGEKQTGDAVLLESRGQFLLMDTGARVSYDVLTGYLDALGVKKFDIYVSHLHVDHYGNMQALTLDSRYEVGRIYFPHSKYAKEYSRHGYFYEEYFSGRSRGLLKQISDASPEIEIVFLEVGNTFSVGDANIEIIGPVGSFKVSQFKSKTKNQRENDYANNYSLSAMVTCGETRYLTCGDSQEEEEQSLLDAYGDSALRADIFKLSHHGSMTSNAEDFIDAVRPVYAFVQNEGIPKLQKGGNGGTYRRTYTPRKRVNKYGVMFSPGDEGQDVVVNVSDDRVTLYRGQIRAKNALTGWITLQGGDGVCQKTDKAYADPETGEFLTGLQRIDGKMYDFGTGGIMEIGSWNTKNKKYQYLKYYDKDFRFYEKTGAIRTGFVRLTKKETGQNGRLVYFDPETGFAKRATLKKAGKYQLVSIKKQKRLINNKGTVYTFGWYVQGGQARFFNKKNGAMKTGWYDYTAGNGKKYTCYLDDKTGKRRKGIHKIGKYKYYFFEDSGILRKTPGKFIRGGVEYSADEQGRLRVVHANGSMTLAR